MNEHIGDFRILRDLRKRAGLSIAELSARCGVAASVISRLERNQSVGEVATLYRIARVFGLTLSDLIALVEKRTSHCVTAEHYDSGDFRFSRVDYGNIRVMRAAAPKGARLSAPERHRDDYELCWVLKGALDFRLPDEKHELHAGDSIQFDALLPHTYEVLEEGEFVIIHLKKGKRF